MADARMQPRIVRVLLEPRSKTGLYHATSPDLKGFLVSETTEEARTAAIPVAISEMYAACGVDVFVTLAAADADAADRYVAMPADLARRELEKRAS